MPPTSGIFDLFGNLDIITAEEISAFSNQQFEHHFVENYLGNRILNPHSIAVTKQELDLDFYILSLAVQKNPQIFFNSTQNRIVIPEVALQYFQPLTRLISVIILVTPAEKISELWLKGPMEQKLLGSFLPALMLQKLNLSGELKIKVQDQEKTLIPNQLNLIPVLEKQVKVVLNELEPMTAVGGTLGIFVDLRGNKV
jgi:hypothetical protein